MRKFALYTLPLLLWMGFIFSLSTDRGSSEHSRPLIEVILHKLVPTLAAQLSPAQFERLDFDLRKTGHVTEYLILTLLAYRAVQTDSRRFRSRHVLFPLFLGLLYAASDEWHQSFVPSRWGVASDVLYDMFGVTLGTVLMQWREQFQREKQTRPTLQKEDGPGGERLL